MIERELALFSLTNLLLLLLAWHIPRLSAHWRRRELGLMVAGSLLPWLDVLLNELVAEDRIEALSREPFFMAPMIGLTSVAAVMALAAFLVPPRTVWRTGIPVLAGYGLFMVTALITPAGIPLLAPFSQAIVALPVFPIGHLPLLVLLGVGVTVMLIRRSTRQWMRPAMLGVVGLYLLLGLGQYGLITYQARSLGGPGQDVHIYPDSNWLWLWQVVVESPEEFQLRRYNIFRADFSEPRYFLRWNDQPLFLKLMADPVVRGFYYRRFKHPVVQMDISGAQVTMLLQELEDQWPLVPGPTFYLESDLNGRNRLYQLQRFH